MKISVLTPTYNREKLLKKLYESLLKNANYGIQIEWLIMDDGSKDQTRTSIEKFKEEIPRYMIKHQVRPGLTGWAQVNGYRGDTSIKKRIEHDLYYIENWTLGFDFKIIFLTFFKGFINKNAY